MGNICVFYLHFIFLFFLFFLHKNLKVDRNLEISIKIYTAAAARASFLNTVNIKSTKMTESTFEKINTIYRTFLWITFKDLGLISINLE